MVSAALGVKGSGLRAADVGAAGAAETGFGADGGVGAPEDGGGVEGVPPSGFIGARGARGLGGTPADGAAGGGGVEGLPDAGPTGTLGAAGLGGAGGTELTDVPAAGTGLGGSFKGGSFMGAGEPEGKAVAGGVFGDGVSLTI